MSEPWKNGDPMDERARRPCACGGTMYDWGVGPMVAGVDRAKTEGPGWVIDWKCQGGCGAGLGHRLSYEEITTIRRGTQDEKDAASERLADGRDQWAAWATTAADTRELSVAVAND